MARAKAKRPAAVRNHLKRIRFPGKKRIFQAEDRIRRRAGRGFLAVNYKWGPPKAAARGGWYRGLRKMQKKFFDDNV